MKKLLFVSLFLLLSSCAPSQSQPLLCGYVPCFDIILQLLIYGATNGAILALNAIGVTVIYSTVRTLNLAHGDVFALTTVLIASLINGIGITQVWSFLPRSAALILVLIVAILFGAGLSAIINRIAFQPFRGRSRLAPLIATLGISFILFQVALVWRTFQASWIPGEHRSVPGLPEVPTDRIPDLLPSTELIKTAHVTLHASELIVILISILFALGIHLFMQNSKTGKAIRACAQNPTLAQILGVDFDRTIMRAFLIGGGMAGAAAFVFAIYYARPLGDHGAQSGLLAFSAALLGGIGNPFGALVASTLLGVFSSLSDYFLNAQWTPILSMTLLIGLLIIKPGGIAAHDEDDSSAVRDSLILTRIDPTSLRRRANLILFSALMLFPLIASALDLGGQIILINAAIFMLLALGLNILLGLAGILDLGFAISFAVGGYTAAIMLNQFDGSPQPDFLIVIFYAVLTAGLIGWLKGLLALRMRGDTLAVATLALALAAQKLIILLEPITKGPTGMGPLNPPQLLSVIFKTPDQRYYLGIVLVIFVAWISSRLLNSRSGRTWIASSEDDLAASSSGINVPLYRLIAFVISSIFAGLAGALQAAGLSYVDPGMASFHISTLALTMVILGGAGSVPGAMIGALLIIGYDKVIVPQAASLLAHFWPQNTFIGSVPDLRGTSYFNFGVALYLTVLFRARKK